MDWNTITIAVIENGSWPFVILVITLLIIFFGDINKLIESIKHLKFGSFSLETREAALEADALTEYKNLSDLTYGQLHLFLVIGGEGSEKTTYKDGMNNFESQENYKKLKRLGLITYEAKEQNVILFGTTEKGKKLHKIIMDKLYVQFNS
ncbi:hypothetical protein J4N43_04795 [Vibrio sp. SCSIO 43009]|uniref:hypothetical protein n=1 Tax=Vibrio sp. SCSIO 43009 TaxID=2819103 RepID=UPI0020762658|nr:hypothetical protein [Vibrio sp. SCSIO 43009]USD75009.1 hypothetical protein J4N43_04795 [Vibrio sp. SCSIO 43009]